MKHIILTLILIALTPTISFAHCPTELSIDSRELCLSLEWDQQNSSPWLNIPPHMEGGQPPQLWQESRAYVQVWEKGDSTHQPVELDSITLYPYMLMSSGHHHGVGTSNFYYAPSLGMYILDGFRFSSMPGCWAIYWTDQATTETLAPQNLQEQQVTKVSSYFNLDEVENEEQANLCSASTESSNGHGGHHQGHQHHSH